MSEGDRLFAGSIPEIYDRYLVPCELPFSAFGALWPLRAAEP